MTFDKTLKNLLLAASLLSLAACNSGSSDAPAGGGGVQNSPPSASAGPDQSVLELSTVTLSGSGTDPDTGDTLSYSWQQLSGVSVSITNSTSAVASFTAPDVATGVSEVLTFRLSVSDGSLTSSDEVAITVSEAQDSVTVSGVVSYEFVPPNNQCRGLNFNAIETRPIRGATVQLIDGSNDTTVLASTRSDDNGNYAFSNVAANTDVRIRVRAELKRTGIPAWDVEVRDNVDTSASPPPLAQRPLYVVQWGSFNTGGTDINNADFTATTGWGTSSYTGTRSAAPFAILDAIYSGIQAIVAERPTEVFAPLDAFWSVNNTPTSPTDIDAGELGTSFYSTGQDSLFLLGDADVDTEEFDDHVTMHEWGHYFEDNFSRSDSVGGSHAIGESLDARLAFGEGWATALSGIVLQEPQYCDTSVAGSNLGFGLDIENENRGHQGWFNEMSVATFIYDLWDTDIDGTDTGSIGFGPIFDTMVGPQSATPAFTTLFSFATELRSMLGPTERAFVDTQLAREDIVTTGIDIWGSNQDSIAEFPNQSRDVLPLYTTLPTDGTTINICANSDFDSGRDGNKLAEYRYLTFTTSSAAQYDVVVTTTTATPVTADPDDRDQSDPDIVIFRRDQVVAIGLSPDENQETVTTQTLPADTYIASLQEWRFEDEEGAPDSFPEQICFDVSMTAR